MRSRALALVVVLPVALAACGSSHAGSTNAANKTASLTPQQALQAAETAFSKITELKATLRFRSTAEAFTKLNAVDPAPGDTPPTPAQAAAVVGGSFTLSEVAPAGKTLFAGSTAPASTDPAQLFSQLFNSTVDFTFSLAGSPAASFRVAGGSVYMRADVKKLAGLGDDPAAALAAVNGAGTNPSIPAALRPVVQEAVAGDWLTIAKADITRIESLAANALKNVPDFTKNSALGAALGPVLEKDALALLQKDVTVTRLSSSGDGDVLQLTAPLQSLASDGLALLKKDLPAALQADLPAAATGVPAKTIAADVTLVDGQLSKITVDLKPYLSPKELAAVGDAPLGIEIDLATTGVTVDVPSDAKAVDVFGLFGSLVGSG